MWVTAIIKHGFWKLTPYLISLKHEWEIQCGSKNLNEKSFFYGGQFWKRGNGERAHFFSVLCGIISMKVKTAILLGTKLSYWQNRKSKNYPASKEPPLGKRGPANWRCGNDSFPHSRLLLWGPCRFPPLASSTLCWWESCRALQQLRW